MATPTPPDPRRAALRNDPAVRAITASWRLLTSPEPGTRQRGPGAPTLVACSGGVDSCALLLALWTTGGVLVVGHVLHDLRPPQEAAQDRDAARALAETLGVPFREAAVQVRAGNREGLARTRRYEALRTLAAEAKVPFVATAHHADDQFESMVMALLRGTGPAGLRGAAPRRSLGGGATLVRPMLAVTRADAKRICRLAGVRWSEDRTNLDRSRLRAALRHSPLRDLEALRPGASLRASRSAGLIRDAFALVSERAGAVFGNAASWPRETLRDERRIVVALGLRTAALRLTGGLRADRVTGRVLDAAVRAVRDHSTDPRRFEWPGGVDVVVEARTVSLERRA